jgi:hypothetical protein
MTKSICFKVERYGIQTNATYNCFLKDYKAATSSFMKNLTLYQILQRIKKNKWQNSSFRRRSHHQILQREKNKSDTKRPPHKVTFHLANSAKHKNQSVTKYRSAWAIRKISGPAQRIKKKWLEKKELDMLDFSRMRTMCKPTYRLSRIYSIKSQTYTSKDGPLHDREYHCQRRSKIQQELFLPRFF